MSFLTRIARRCRPSGPALPAIQPKGAALLRETAAQTPSDEAPEDTADTGEAVAQPMRRPTAALRQPAAAPVRRSGEGSEPAAEDAPDTSEEDAGTAAAKHLTRTARTPLARAAEPPGEDAEQPAAEESGPARPARRAAAAAEEPSGEDEALARTALPPPPAPHLSREIEDGPASAMPTDAPAEDESDARPLRRQSAAAPEALTADNAPKPEEAPDEPMNELRAKPAVGAMNTPPPPPGNVPAGEPAAQGTPVPDAAPRESAPMPAPVEDSVFAPPPPQPLHLLPPAPADTAPGSTGTERPKIHIDQVDVVIQEPAAPAPAAAARPDRSRMFRARYLGGL